MIQWAPKAIGFTYGAPGSGRLPCLLVTGRAPVEYLKWLSRGAGVAETAGPLSLHGQARQPHSGQKPKGTRQVAALLEPAKLYFPFNHSLPPGRGKMWFGEEGSDKQGGDRSCHLHQPPVHSLPITACVVIGQSPAQDSTPLPSHLPIPISQEGRGWGWPAIRF